MRVYEKTHCVRGHSLTGPHIRLTRADGYVKRVCRICQAANKRAYILRKVRGSQERRTA